MMKNIAQILLISIAVLCVGLMIGILISGFETHHTVPLSAYDKTYEDRSIETLPYRTETQGKININNASVEELTMLPGIGKTYAERIVSYRNKYGPFISIDDLTKVDGIGKKRVESIKEYITVGG